MHKFIFRTFLISIALLAAPAWAQTQTAEQSSNPAPRWLVNCNNQANQAVLACAMSQSIIRAQTRQRIVTANIFKDEKGSYVMRLVLPHGLDLTKGVSFSIDNGTPTQYAITTADANGSYARIPLSDAVIEALKAGNTAIVAVSNIGGNNINLEISLSGFSASFALLN
ncbi:MAG: invasion associated locus B family protein [Pseudomonadota bacterium]